MTNPKTHKELDAGSRMHVLDLLDAPDFIPTMQGLIEDLPFRISEHSQWRPKGRHDPRESVLTGVADPFLSLEAKSELLDWWLVHKRGAKLPTWDLVMTASTPSGSNALILVEAKAHVSEFGTGGKPKAVRETLDQRARSDANHQRIATAIDEASEFLGKSIPGVLLTRDAHYQFANRVAFAWKLASMGVPVVLVYLGFTGDTAISKPGDFFADDHHWQSAFRSHIAPHFPSDTLEKEIDCGAASFWLVSRSLTARRVSPDVNQRSSLR